MPTTSNPTRPQDLYLPKTLLALIAAFGLSGAAQGAPSSGNSDNPTAVSEPLQLRQNPQALLDDATRTTTVAQPTSAPGEFERFVQSVSGSTEIRRLGSDLVAGNFDSRGADLSPVVPQDYTLSTGDEILINLWGSVEADLRLTIDRTGRIAIPRVGSVQLAGVRFGDLQETISRRVSQVFKGYQLSVSIGQLRGIRIFVTGFVVRPGTYTVTSLSTVVPALMRAGGPSAAGSFRNIELRRMGQLVGTFDLYDLLQKGDRSNDIILKAGDVVHVGQVGQQVGVIGSVNRATVLELKPTETIADAIRLAGGLSAVADTSRLSLERLRDRTGARIVELRLPESWSLPLESGDVLRAMSAVESVLPSQRQSKRVKIDGEVLRPAEYILPDNATIDDAIRAAGGLTKNAFLFAAEFTRDSVRTAQVENYERALRNLESDLIRANSARRSPTAAADAQARQQSELDTTRLIERLRSVKPTGRVILPLTPESTTLPPLSLENGDRLYIPPQPNTVGVYGSVFNAATYLHNPGRKLGDYVRLAGGATKGADENSSFVVRANGQVISNRSKAGWFSTKTTVEELQAQAGDTVFVPEEINKSTALQFSLDWTQLIYQLGLGIAGFVQVFK